MKTTNKMGKNDEKPAKRSKQKENCTYKGQ